MTKKIIVGFAFIALVSILHVEAKADKSDESAQKEHAKELDAIQQQFLKIENHLGLSTPVSKMREVRNVKKKQGTPAQMDTVRIELNTLLSNNVLSDPDIKNINQNIALLQSYNPAYWPRATDYKALLKAKLAEGITPKPFKKFQETQKRFKTILQQQGIATPPAKLRKIRKIKGQKAPQPRFDAVRSELNELLSKKKLTGADVKIINEKIEELKGLNPEFWPGPKDYKALLKIKMK